MASVVTSFDPTARASANSITFKQLNLETAAAQRPEVIAVLAQCTDAKSPDTNVPVLADGTPEQAFALYGASPLYYAAEALFPLNGDGAKCDVYYVPVPKNSSGTSAAGSIELIGTAATSTFTAVLTVTQQEIVAAADAVGKIATNAQSNPATAPRGKQLDSFNTLSVSVVIAKGLALADVVTAISNAASADVHFPYFVTASGSGLLVDAKFAGVAGNATVLLTDSDGVELSESIHGIGATQEDATGGAGVLDVSDALANMTESYGFTRIVNQFSDDDNLDRIQAWGEAKSDSLVAQYPISYFGKEYIESSLIAGTVDIAAEKLYGDARRDDRINSVIKGTYGDLRELEYSQRNTLNKAGISNIEIRSGVPTLMDSVTFYHPEGVTNPIFRYDVDITKIGNIAYDLQYYFGTEEWESKILVSKDSKTTNPNAISISEFAAAVYGRAELWEKTALIAESVFVKENSVFAIDDSNPNRINSNIKARLSSTLRILDNTLFLGFLFGESA